MLSKLASRPDWQIALVFTAVLRAFYTATAAAFIPFLHPATSLIRSNELTENLPSPHGLHYALLGIWDRFDTLWYLRIAEHGYDRPMAVIFYPLYPATIRFASTLMPATAGALVVSTLAAFFFFWGLLRLAGELSEVGKTSHAAGRHRVADQLRLVRGLCGVLNSGAGGVGRRLRAGATVGCSRRMRSSCWTGTALGSAGSNPPVGYGVTEPPSTVASSGSRSSRIAQLLALAAMVGASLGGRSLPALSGHDHGPAVERFRRGSTFDRNRRGRLAGHQTRPGDPGCRYQPVAPKTRPNAN